MRKKLLTVCAAVVMLASVNTLAQQTFVPPRTGIRLIEEYRPETAGETKVIGTVSDTHLLPVKNVKLQIRDLATGLLAGETMANENGEYEFTLLSSSTYVVEALLHDGSIGGVSNAGSVDRYQTLQTFIQLPGRWETTSQRVVPDRNFARFLGVSAQTTLTAQTLDLAMKQNIVPQQPGEPVSP